MHLNLELKKSRYGVKTLQLARKTTKTTSEYFMNIKQLEYNLAIAGLPLKPDDIITYIHAGLGLEYNSLVITIFFRDD